VEESDADVRREGPLEVGQAELLEIRPTDEPDDVIEEQDPSMEGKHSRCHASQSTKKSVTRASKRCVRSGSVLSASKNSVVPGGNSRC